VKPTLVAPAGIDRAAIVDEYGDLAKESSAFSPKERRLTELRKIIQSWYEAEPPAKDFIAEGKRFTIAIGAREYQKKVNPLRLYKLIGIKRFLTVVSITLEAMKAAGMEALQIRCVDETHTGKRKLTPVAKAQTIPIASGRKRPYPVRFGMEERAAA
jgi:hypothetical protein